MKARLAIAMLAIAILCVSVMAQEMTAEDWYKKGQSLIADGSGYNIDDALAAFDNVIQIDPQNIDAWLGKAQSLVYLNKKNESLEAFSSVLNLTNGAIEENPEDAKAWQSKGIALASLGREAEATDAFEKSIDVLNQSLQSDPKDVEAWWLKAENLEILGRSDSALEAYDEVIALNSSKAVGAWIRESDIFYGQPGGYNQSQDAFGKAVDLMKVNSTSFISFWYPEDDHVITLNEWMIDGQIVRVDFGRYNKSLQAYDDLVQTRTNSNLFSAWQSKGRAITPQGKTLGKQSEHLLGSSLNWVVYNFSKADFPGSNGSVDLLQEDTFEENTANGWYKKGLHLSQKGTPEEAVRAYDKAIEIEPQNATLWFAKGQGLLSTTYGPIGLRGEERTAAEEAAIKAYDKAIQIDPNYADAWGGKGYILLQIASRNSTVDMDRCNESLYSFDKALELNPKDANAWQGRGTLLFGLNRFEEAIESYDRALESDPSYIGASQGKAQALAKLGRKNESAKAYDKSLETVDREIEAANSPENLSQAWVSKGIVLQEQGRYEDAANALDNATNADPKNEMAWKVKGYVLSVTLKKHSEAVEAFDKALQINSEDPFTWQRKGDALKALGRNSEADAAFAKAEGLGYQISYISEVDTAEAWYQKGQELDRNGSYNESIQAYYRALNLTNETLEKNPDDANAWQTKGLVLERLYRQDESAIAFDKAVELHPDNAFAWLHKGKALDLIANRQQGQDRTKAFEDAIRAYDRAIEIDPNFGEAWMDKGYSLHSLATFNKNLSEYNGSLKAFDKAIKLIPANDIRNLALAWDGRAITLTGMGNTFDDMGMKEEAKGTWEEALGDYGKAIELDSNFTGLEARLHSAGVLADLGRYNESLVAYDNAIATKPNFPPGDNPMYVALILTNKGSVLEKIGKHEDALKAFNDAIELFPENAAAWKGKGDVLNSTGGYDEAVKAYDMAIELIPQPGPLSAYSWQGKGLALKALGRQTEADEAFAKAENLGYQG